MFCLFALTQRIQSFCPHLKLSSEKNSSLPPFSHSEFTNTGLVVHGKGIGHSAHTPALTAYSGWLESIAGGHGSLFQKRAFL